MTESHNHGREPIDDRSHETYEEDHWRVVDIEDVDKVFATGDDEEVRIDIDGYVSSSTISEFGEDGDNINTSIWMKQDVARDLLQQLEGEVKK